MQKIFTLGVDTNKIQVISPLDHETKPTSYNFLIITTNKCVNMPDLEDVEVKSRLNLTVKVDDINDVVPRFDRDPIFEGIFVDDDQTWMKTISVVDPDEMDNTFTFDMGPIAVSSDNTGLDVIKDGAFELKASSGPNAMIVAKFTRQESMKGFFKFNLTVSDSGEVHSHTAEVKVVIIAPENKITLRFDNQPEEVDALDKEIKAVFEENFEGWLYTKDSSRPDTFATKNNTAGTVVECHFLDSEFDPVNQREAQAQYELVFRELTLGLANFSLTLKRENGFGTGEMGLPEDESGASTATIVLIIATALLALILVCLVVTYFIRVSNLERKVKAMGFDAFGSQASDLNRAGYNSNEGLPNTNNFASSGANPIFNIEDDIADFGNAPYQTDNPLGKNIQSAYADNGREFDASSLGSGDSVLIGIENQAEFKNYEGQSRNISRPRFDDSDTTMDDSDFELSDLDESPRENRPHTNLFNRLDLSDAIPAPSLDLGGSPFGGGGGNPLYHSDDEN
ncbi:hypothetical protein TCAL_16764 [Tigriopus californicus]|uniref:Cadherin domain-containing protein n=2 Tax=Tigriopus californicus TaxID=6832 RepID=A0A553PSK6_TIGCA|nr:hypothetical protein TCAL_16764 [Tigriopus californicus]